MWNFRNLSIRPHKISSNHCNSLASNFKVELKLSTDTDMLLKVEKGITGGICHYINKYAKANNKYMKDYDTNKESSNLKYWN